jgi:hypothetical protein
MLSAVCTSRSEEQTESKHPYLRILPSSMRILTSQTGY